MIAKMLEISIVGRKRDANKLMQILQNAGVVQIDELDSAAIPRKPLSGPEATHKAQLERQLARVESSLSALDALETAPTKNFSPASDSYLEDIGHRIDDLVRQQADLEAELALVNAYQRTARVLADLIGNLDRSKRVNVFAFSFGDAKEFDVLQKMLDENLSGRYSLATKPVKSSINTGAVAVLTQDAAAARNVLSRSGIGELRFPGRFESMSFKEIANQMELLANSGPAKLLSIKQELDNIKHQHAGDLVALQLSLQDELSRYQALEMSARGRFGFALRGWVPEDDKPALENALKSLDGQLIYLFSEPDLHHSEEVPVKLQNNSFVKPFELLMGIFAPPGYGTFDPTWVIAVCFPIFFGFVIGDIGFGLTFLLGAFALNRMSNAGKTLNLGPFGIKIPPIPLKKVSTILMHMSLWAIAFGFLYGEVFGTLGQNLALFHVVVTGEHSEVAKNAAEAVRLANEKSKSGIPILLPRVKTDFASTMLMLALIPGIVQILYGWFIRFRLGLAHKDKKHIFEGLGMFVGLVGIILYSYKFRNGENAPDILIPVALVCLAIFLVCVVLSGVVMMLIELLSNGGNILSYLRLYAVGLSSALLANLATDFGWNLGASIGPIGIVVGIVVALLVHVIALALTIIGHVLQPLRLHYAEFFTKFGFFEASGRPYKPLNRSSENMK